MELAGLRKDYTLAGLSESELDADPFKQFALWFEEAREAKGTEPNAMTLATASADGRPSARTVLLKGIDLGFVFYTNYDGAKGRELAANPRAELVFFWPEVERQVRINGQVERVDRATSEAYFRSRPRGNQIGAIVSPQSQVILGREPLDDEYARFEDEFEGEELPFPDYWGGFRVIPASFEFWQGRRSRLHDRLRYRRGGSDEWIVERLAP